MSVECLWCTDRTSVALEEHTLCKGCRLILAATCPADMHRDVKPENVTLREAAEDVYNAWIPHRYDPEEVKTAMAVLRDVLDGAHVVDPAKAQEDRGTLITRHASLGMRLVQLSAELPEVEKLARKTPRRDMPELRALVEVAKSRVEPLRDLIAKAMREHVALHERIAQLGGYGQDLETAKGGGT